MKSHGGVDSSPSLSVAICCIGVLGISLWIDTWQIFCKREAEPSVALLFVFFTFLIRRLPRTKGSCLELLT